MEDQYDMVDGGRGGVALKPQVKYDAGQLDVAVRNTLRKYELKVSNFGKQSQKNLYVSSDMYVLGPVRSLGGWSS